MSSPDAFQTKPSGSGAEPSPPNVSPLDEEACAWVERFALGKGSRADLAELRRWIDSDPAHAKAFERVSRVWTELEPVAAELTSIGLVSPDQWRRSRQALRRRSGLARRAFIGGAMAAAAGGAALVVRPPLGLWPSLTELAADVRTRPGEQRQVTLANQVSIDMNTRTSISLQSAEGEARLLAGEAMISSQPQWKAPFTLLAADGRIIATTAKYNVRIDSDNVCVTCVTGIIQVEQRHAAVKVQARQQVRYSNSGISLPAIVDPAVVAAWQDGVIVFEATPISEVIAEVNRYRPGRIILTNKGLGRRLFDARLRIENIGNVVRQIELTFGAHTRELPGGIVLLG